MSKKNCYVEIVAIQPAEKEGSTREKRTTKVWVELPNKEQAGKFRKTFVQIIKQNIRGADGKPALRFPGVRMTARKPEPNPNSRSRIYSPEEAITFAWLGQLPVEAEQLVANA